MALMAALVYWIIVPIWLSVLGTLLVFYIRNPRIIGTTRLLLAVVAIDTSRNIVENVYFGLYFGSQYGMFPAAVTGILGNPGLLILPKIMNVVAGCIVLGLLLLRWLPSAVNEHRQLEFRADHARGLASMMEELVANVSHELRTPLTSISGSLGLLAAGAAGRLPDGAARLISIAHTNAQRLVRLINDILDIGKMEAGSMIFEFAPIDLRVAVEQTIDANRALAEEQGVSIRLDSSSPSLSVRADADRLIQVVTNLLSNAIKFSPRDSEVLVTIVQRPLTGCVMVRDHGAGIPVEFRSRIFGKFAQARTVGSPKKVGSGLGLNIVAKIATQHSGSCGFDDAPDGGTIFHFDIPLWNKHGAETSATLQYAVAR